MSNILSEVHPELVAEWSDKNLPLTPDRITYGSNKVVWWKGACGHEWQTSVKARSNGENCPICSGARVIEGVNDLATLKPELADEWSSKNDPLNPTMVTTGSHKKVIWQDKYGHEWTATVKSRALNGTGCPYCSHNKILVGFNDLASQRPQIASEWSERNYPLKPDMVTVFANRKVWWRCSKGHEYLVSFPRNGDSNYNAEWGHGSLNFMNGWKTGNTRYTTVRSMGSHNGNICYCIEIGVPQQTGDSFTKKGEDFWDNYPSSYNSTISPDDIKLFIGRIFQYGYTGTISTSWRSDNEGGDKLAHAVATQLLIWETVIGERDENFNKVSTGGKNAVLDQISTNHPLYNKIMSYYNSMAASVQKHSNLPSFLSKTPGGAKEIELEWDGSKYTVTLTDTNNVLSGYKFSSNDSDVNFSVSGNKLTITSDKAPSDGLTITAEKTAQRKGVITWTDGIYGPDGGVQDTVTYAQTVNDPVKGFLKLKVSYGSAKIIKTSEDGKVDGISFRIQGNGIDKTVKTENGGQIQVDNLMPGVYTVTEQEYDRYEPQETRRVTVVAGQVATVNFNNTLKRGDIEVIKSSEDNFNEGVTFHLYGTSLSGIAVDEYAVTDKNGVATFEDVLISGTTPYTIEEVDTAIRYVIPEDQTAPVKWNEVTTRNFTNVLKKFTVTVTKSDAETGTAQGNASLAGAKYGIFKGEQLIDEYYTDENGQFTTKEYICDSDWTIKELEPSEGYLLDPTIHKVGAEPELYTIEHIRHRSPQAVRTGTYPKTVWSSALPPS